MIASISGTTPRFFFDGSLSPGTEVDLPERAARHCKVLRLARGEAVVLFNGEGGEYAAELTGNSRDRVSARLLSKRLIERESPLAVELAQCVPSGDRMDIAVQKATELGVQRIVPIASSRSIVKLSGSRAELRIARWRNVAISACEQCGRNRVPEIASISDLQAFVSEARGEAQRLLLAPEAARELKSLAPPSSVTLLVGPEGGLAPEERHAAERNGFLPVRFGPRVLRTETAPLAAIAAMQALWGDC